MPRFLSILLLTVFFCSAVSLKAQEDEVPYGKLAEANRAMKNRNYHEAEILYRELLNQNPDDKILQQYLCHSLINQNEFVEADSMLWRMVEKDSNNKGNYWYLGLSCERQRMDSIAADYFKTYIRKTDKFTSKDVKAYLHVGSAYRRLMHDTGISVDQFNSMVYHYEKYLKLNPVDPYAGELESFLLSVKPKKPDIGKRLVWDEKS